METDLVNIGCSASSGSTVFARLLDCHPQIACGRELYLFSKPLRYDDFDFVKRRANLIRFLGLSSNPLDEGRAILKGLDGYKLTRHCAWQMLSTSRSMADFAGRFHQHVLGLTNKSVWAEKTPANIMCFSRFLHVFPQAKIIHIIRDPRDCVLSIMRRGSGCSLLRAAETWLSRVAAGYSVRGDSRVLDIHYEDLVLHTLSTMEKVCRFIGLAFDPNYFADNRFASQGLTQFAGHSSWLTKPNAPISSGSVGKYLRTDIDLSALSSVRLTQEFARILNVPLLSLIDLAQAYGYDLAVQEGQGIYAPTRTLGPRKTRSRLKSWMHSLVERESYVDKIVY